jgi:hypothetical protein
MNEFGKAKQEQIVGKAELEKEEEKEEEEREP